MLHSVIDGETSSYMTSGRIDIEGDWSLRISFLKIEKLCYNGVGNRRVNSVTEKDNAIFEESRVNIVSSLLSPNLINNRWNEKI
jgi:hypothetical protein